MNPILKRTLTGIAVGLAVIAAILFTPPRAIAPVVAAFAVLATLEYVLLLRAKFAAGPVRGGPATAALLFLAGAALVTGGLWALAETAFRHGNLTLLYLVAIVKFSDVGGFAVGTATAKMMKGGNHKLCPSVSPGKSWEGLFGSLVFSCVVSCAFIAATEFSVEKSLALGVVAAILGTAGDLVESKFKRWVGVKDSSAMKITNGMGGILDMIDSLLIAPAVLLCFL